MSNDLSFNLVTDPWIKVLKKDYTESEVSLNELFSNSEDYLQLAGDMKSQDLAILRLLLAILLSVYTRFDADDTPYSWLDLDDKWRVTRTDNDGFNSQKLKLENTWRSLYDQKAFSKKLFDYLNLYQTKFDLFGEDPFYQVNRQVYDQNVPENKKVAKGAGTVSVKQINRLISESNNSPALFSPKSGIEKDSVNNAELVRWLITYQNFTGVTDKTKVKSKDKFSVSPGWLYSINPVYIKGKTLFDTLMLNLSLVTNDSADGTNWLNSQRPVWEYDDINDYLQQRLNGVYPDNLSELYTVWSRMIHIDWQNGQPVIFSAGLPKLDSEKQFLEPMTTWRKNKDGVVYPAAKNKNNINVAMWRNFGQYIRTKANEDEKRIPGIVSWIQELKKEKYISKHTNINIVTVAMISDGNATSQSPYAEITDNMQAKAGVLFDDEPMFENRWQDKIEEEVLLAQKVVAYFYWFAKDISNIQTHSEKKKSNDDWASRKVAQLYDELNQPFYTWLSGLDINQDRNVKIKEWRETLNRLVATQAKNIFVNATADEIIGGKEDNIFTIYNKLRRNVYVCLGLK